MDAFEEFLDYIETANPSEITIFCPRFSIGFFWKFIDAFGLYRRKNLECINVYISRFNQEDEVGFSLNECLELQELFPKINLSYVDLNNRAVSSSLLPGIIYLIGASEKSYAFESDFSLKGFSRDKVITAFSTTKAKTYLLEINEIAIKIDRQSLDAIRIKYLSAFANKPPKEVLAVSNPDFLLSFTSARTGKIHNSGAGLNWGQPTESRKRKDLNAAYLAVPVNMQKSEIVPISNHNFLCKFEDGVEIEMVRTGQNGKNLTSSYENQIFGRYIRFKLGIAPGEKITQDDLVKSNISGLSFYKINIDFYFVKFNPF